MGRLVLVSFVIWSYLVQNRGLRYVIVSYLLLVAGHMLQNGALELSRPIFCLLSYNFRVCTSRNSDTRRVVLLITVVLIIRLCLELSVL